MISLTRGSQDPSDLKINGLVWLENFLEKPAHRHDVLPVEARKILVSSPHFRFTEEGHRRGENVYAALDQTEAGRYLVVYFVRKRDGKALILSARDVTRAEPRLYEQRQKFWV